MNALVLLNLLNKLGKILGMRICKRKDKKCVLILFYPPTKSQGYSFGFVRACMHPSVHSVRVYK